MNKNIVYTIGYTLFQKDNVIDIESLFKHYNNIIFNIL